MNPHEALITELVLDTTKDMPTRRRAQYIHALARLTSDDKMVEEFAKLANELDAADERQTQLRTVVQESLQRPSIQNGKQ